ncbi:hypothetical protein SCP_0802760 [Sparassis crispa]|uniref:Uncharacterized protein n=1 Tax=Sparassis crispa TaxID=139825 RepID=A0A401GVH9_9APHY|nr:hypothetical protein SCP_0802760 [Sparassis crispa]GBE85754.1 hypothetical protein SCP_0802760 [Sparassis crispa]
MNETDNEGVAEKGIAVHEDCDDSAFRAGAAWTDNMSDANGSGLTQEIERIVVSSLSLVNPRAIASTPILLSFLIWIGVKRVQVDHSLLILLQQTKAWPSDLLILWVSFGK